MLDKQIAALFLAQLLPRIQAVTELAGVKLARSYQSRQQGASTTPYVYFFKLGDHKHGSPKRKGTYSTPSGAFDHIDLQQYETTYQFSTWVPQTPENVASLTESDILNIVSGIMQSDSLITAFKAAGAGVERITDVRNPYVVDERDQFEAIPTFDIVLTHTRQTASTIPAVVSYDAILSRV